MRERNERLDSPKQSFMLILVGIMTCMTMGCSDNVTNSTKTGVVGQGKLLYHWSRKAEHPTGTDYQVITSNDYLRFQIVREDKGKYSLTGDGLLSWKESVRSTVDRRCRSWEAATAGAVTLSGHFVDFYNRPIDADPCTLYFSIQIDWKQPTIVRQDCEHALLPDLGNWGRELSAFRVLSRTGHKAFLDIPIGYGFIEVTSISLDSSTGCAL